jgi:glycosyltransferase involved in cell wall biosynthesis
LKVVFFANTEWYLFNFRLDFAKFLREHDFEVVMVSPAGPYGARLRAEGFRWIEVAMDRRSVHPARELALLRQISKIYRAERPDIVHHFTIKCVVYGSLIAWWHGIQNRVNAVAGLGYVFTSNGLRARLLRPVVRSLMRSVVGGDRARLILQNKDDLAAFRSSRLVPQTNLRLIRGSGVDTTRFRPCSVPREHPLTRVLLAARLLWDKGLREYVEAARRVRADNLPIEFIVAGLPDPGNPSSVLLRDVAEWQEKGWITYLGHVDDMPALLRSIDIAVLPSYREGAPRSLIEAAAAGLPIITTDAPGCREVVEHGVNGLLVPVREVGALAAAIRFLHERPRERREMGRSGREKVLQELDQRIVFEQTLSVYHEVLEPSSAPSEQAESLAPNRKNAVN